MLKVIRIVCKDCFSIKLYPVGREKNDTSLKKILSRFRGKTRKQMEQIIANEKIIESDYGYAIFACPKCKNLYDRYAVKIVYGDGKIFTPDFRCKKCRQPLEQMADPIENYACHQCGKYSLTMENHSPWI